VTEVTTTAGDLRMGDLVRFPDGQGGKLWAPVGRARADGASVEVLFAFGGAAEYRTFEASARLVRKIRNGEEAA
jgi:hypothetical protein